MHCRRADGAGSGTHAGAAMELIEFLKEKNDFVSGQEIADAMHISRNAVWKQIEH
ncbi:MAG: HTH domain-containing protein, partial [Lachnospiraceae bacterium]|nr:HTH domain-containing protein [Lachnospiraceae bacterium]